MHSRFNYKVLLFVSICMLVFGVGFGFYAFPRLLKKLITGQVQVSENSKLRPFYINPPFFLEYRIYLFNLTNKEEVNQGKKPKLQEIGPYFFELWKEKFDLIDDEEEDTLTYHYKQKYIFRPDLSGPGLTGNERIIMPHPLLASMFLSTNVDKKPLLKTVESVAKVVFNDPADVFYVGTAMDLMFDGIIFDCGGEDKTAAAFCLTVEDDMSFTRIDADHIKFSLFGGMNDTDLGVNKVYRGKKDYRDVGRLISQNGETETDIWGEDEECNKYRGTDTTIIASYLEKDEALWGYDPSICRPLGATYRKPAKYNELNMLLYGMDLWEGDNYRPECHCREDGTCPPKGTFDMFRCSGAPLIASLPHFFQAEELLSGIESGLNPNYNDHAMEIYIDLMTGIVVSVAKRMHFSLEVKPIPEIEIMKDLPDCIIPLLFWIQESLSLEKKDTDKLKIFFTAIKVIKLSKWAFSIFGVIGIVMSFILMQMSPEK